MKTIGRLKQACQWVKANRWSIASGCTLLFGLSFVAAIVARDDVPGYIRAMSVVSMYFSLGYLVSSDAYHRGKDAGRKEVSEKNYLKGWDACIEWARRGVGVRKSDEDDGC